MKQVLLGLALVVVAGVAYVAGTRRGPAEPAPDATPPTDRIAQAPAQGAAASGARAQQGAPAGANTPANGRKQAPRAAGDRPAGAPRAAQGGRNNLSPEEYAAELESNKRVFVPTAVYEEKAKVEIPLDEVAVGDADPLSKPFEDGIVWYGTWEDAMVEVERTGKPVMLHFGSPRCPKAGVNVPGTW